MPALSRRQLLGTLATLGLAAGCSHAPGATSTPSQHVVKPSATSSQDPFGVPSGSQVQWWIDDSLLPADWARRAATTIGNQALKLDVQVDATTQLGTRTTPRLAAGTPPDLLLDQGADELGIAAIATQLADLTPLLSQPSGSTTLEKALRQGARSAGTLAGRLVALPTAWFVHGLWYSSTLFSKQGWQPPTTFTELEALGRKAQKQQRYLFCWGRDSATWFQRMVLASAVKSGGRDVLDRLAALQSDSWSQSAVQQALTAMKQLVDGGHVLKGGSQTAWKDVSHHWRTDQDVLLAPAGSWIATQASLADGFGLDLVPDPALDADPQLGSDALHAGPGAWLAVPAKAGNLAGGREVLLQLLQPALARSFSQTTQAPSSLLDSLPGTVGTALQHQLAALEAAGSNTFGLDFLDLYGTNHDHQMLWNAFLEGEMDVKTLTAESQAITDALAKDASIPKRDA